MTTTPAPASVPGNDVHAGDRHSGLFARAALTWIDLDSRPYDWRYFGGTYDEGPDHQEPEILPAVLELLDGDQVAVDALYAVINDPDSATCQSNGCKNGIGEFLHEDDDNPARGGLVWHFTTLVRLHTKCLLVCEECSPSNIYDVGVG